MLPSSDNITIATRRSPLALWQADHVRTRLLSAHPGLRVTLLPLVTEGDRFPGRAASGGSGKALFVKELEDCLLDGRADLAVHSVKDVQARLPDGLVLPIILARGPAADVLVCRAGCGFSAAAGLEGLPARARIGTSSLRRRGQLLAARGDLCVIDMHGNVGSRLRRLDAGEFHAILLAEAGLRRLGQERRIDLALPEDLCLPAPGQGAIGLECRSGDAALLASLRPLHDPDSAACVLAERAFSRRLAGACRLPIGALARITQQRLLLKGRVVSPEGGRAVQGEEFGAPAAAEAVGARLAERLLTEGARAILRELAPA